jgi:ankyrin repeat protein
LLKKGADVAAKNQHGETALILAARECHEQVVGVLLDRGANPRIALDRGTTVLMIAAAACPRSLLELLLSN